MTQMPLTGLRYNRPKRISADPYGPNPLVTDLSASSPGMFVEASERRPAPTLFASGDVPPFTTSGVPPELLSRLPWSWRHAAAVEPDRSRVLELIEKCAMDRDAMGAGDGMNAHGLMDYFARMEEWTHGLVHHEDLDDDVAGYPEEWLADQVARGREAEFVAAEQRAQSDYEQQMADLAQRRDDQKRRRFLLGDLADQTPAAAGDLAAPTDRRN